MSNIKKTHLFLHKWVSRIEYLFLGLSSLLLLGMVFIITMSVIGRYFFNSPGAWTVEISEYLMLIITFFTVSWVLKEKGHVHLDLVVKVFPENIQKITSFLTLTMGLIASVILGKFALQVAIDLYKRDVVLLKLIHMPQYIVILPIAIGSFILCMRFIVLILEEIE